MRPINREILKILKFAAICTSFLTHLMKLDFYKNSPNLTNETLFLQLKLQIKTLSSMHLDNKPLPQCTMLKTPQRPKEYFGIVNQLGFFYSQWWNGLVGLVTATMTSLCAHCRPSKPLRGSTCTKGLKLEKDDKVLGIPD